MAWTYRQKKWRDDLRAAYTAETGRDDYRDPTFLEWAAEHYPDALGVDADERSAAGSG